jgi:dihydroorotate dehydrogenase
VVYRALFDTFAVNLDTEAAHRAGFAAVRAGRAFSPALFPVRPEPVEVMGVEFPHRFGMAAGFDKNAEGVLGLLALGFGHVEIGTVTARPQPGNDQPRLFRLPADDALINRMGFNNIGAAEVAANLHKLRKRRKGRAAVVGVNIGKSKVTPLERAVDDYVESARLLTPYADYLVVNVSSPNTPGLRDLQAVESLRPILEAVVDIAAHPSSTQHRSSVPVVVKIAPDLADTDIDAVADLALDCGLAGISATNTTIARPATLRTPMAEVEAMGAGGLSGPVLAPRAEEVLARLRQRVTDRLTLFGVGGIAEVSDVQARITAGADLVQAYTGFIYGGPAWPARMARASQSHSPRFGQ